MKAVFRAMVLAVLASASLTAQAEPPAESGNVIRFNTNFYAYFFVKGGDQPLTVFLGIDIVEFCALGIFDADTFSIQQSIIRDGQRIVSHEKAEVYASVWPIAGIDCGYFLSNPPLATGMAKFRRHDNDLNPNLNPDGNNIVTRSYMANGVLESPEGTRRPMQLSWHAMWDGMDPATYKDIFRLELR